MEVKQNKGDSEKEGKCSKNLMPCCMKMIKMAMAMMVRVTMGMGTIG